MFETETAGSFLFGSWSWMPPVATTLHEHKQNFSNSFQGYLGTYLWDIYLAWKTIPQYVDPVSCIGR